MNTLFVFPFAWFNKMCKFTKDTMIKKRKDTFSFRKCLPYDKHKTLSAHYDQHEDVWPNTWLGLYNPPYTEQNDTDIVGQSIIQLSSEAVRDSFKSAWKRAAKQSSLAALCCFHHTNPSAQHELHPHPVCLLLPRPQSEGGGNMLHLSFFQSLSQPLCLALRFEWHK